jgi:hypothetical protein
MKHLLQMQYLHHQVIAGINITAYIYCVSIFTSKHTFMSIPSGYLSLSNATVTKFILLILFFCFMATDSQATVWTTGTAGPITTMANWTNGTSSPTTFATPGDTWKVTMIMTMPSTATWTLGISGTPTDSLIFLTGGTLNITGAGGTANVTVYGTTVITGGTFNLGGAGTTANINCYGLVGINSGTVNSSGSSTNLTINIHGDFPVTGGTVTTSGASSRITTNTYGNFSMTGGSFVAGGASGKLTTYVLGNCSISGTAAMTNTGAGCTNTVHLALPSGSGTMMADNTSTGTWSGTNIYVDTACTAQLDGDFSTSTGAAAFGLTVDGTLLCPAAFTVNGTRKFTLNGIGTLVVGHSTGINGAIVTTGTKTFSNSANYGFNGTVAQVTGSFLPVSLVAPDTIFIVNSAGVTLSQTTATTGKLLFANGILNTTPAFTMSVPGNATAVVGAGATSYVDGTLIKTIAGLTTVNYEVGDVNYSPMMLSLSTAATAGSLGIKTTNGLHPSVATSGLLSANMVNHYWTITNLGAAGPATVTPQATYNAVDILGGSNASFALQEYSGTAWLGAAIVSTNTSSPYTSAPTIGIALSTLAGAYIFGNVFCGTLPVTGTMTVCTGATTSLSDATAGGLWVSGTPSVATVSTTGVVTGVTAGVATISYTVGTCVATAVVTVNAIPAAGTITGPDTVVCVTHALALADAVPGGIWASNNIALATITGIGVVTGVAPGIDTITYTVSNTCGTATTKKRIKVITLIACHTGIEEPETGTITELNVFPNPTTGTCSVTVKSVNNAPVHIVVTNIVGQIIREVNATTNKGTDIMMGSIPGVYIISAATSEGTYNAKVLVK